jgi:predicted PurR-regulated permease PerM
MKQQNQWSNPTRYLAFGVLFVLIAIGLFYIRTILEPLIIAAFIAYLINPAVNYLTSRTHFSRNGAVNLVYFVTLAVLVGTPPTITSLFFDELTQVATDTSNIFDKLIAWLNGPQPIPGIPIDFGQFGAKLTQFRSTLLSSLPDQAWILLGKTSLGALRVLVILVGVYYFLSEWPRLRNGFIQSFPEAYQPELSELYRRLRAAWMNYLRGQLLLMVIVGVVFSITWTIIGIPGSLVLGLAAGFLTLIPDVGPFLAALLAIGVALLEGSNWSWMPSSNFIVALIVLAAYLVLITIKNLWLRPHIMGRSVRMDEAVVLISIILATILWGLLGALLIVPTLASLIIIFDYLRRRVLNMPPFPPEEIFVSEAPPPSGSGKGRVMKTIISRKKG